MKQTNTTTISDARKLLTCLRIMEDHITDENIIGISIWSDEAVNCMIHIEVDNRKILKAE